MSKINEFNTHIIGKPFEYHQPETVEEAVKILDKLDNARIMVGGTDLIPKMKQRLFEPTDLVNLKKIPELTGIKETKDGIWIGATTKLREIERSKLVQDKIPLQYLCTKTIGSVQIRNMGTLGGNVCNASPAADGALGLVTLNAIAHMAGVKGTRDVPVEDFFVSPGKSVLAKDEIVTGFTVPIPEKGTGCHFISIGRMALDISTISIAVTVTIEDGKVKASRISLGSVAAVPLRLPKIDEYLVGKELTDELIIEVAGKVSASIKPIDDIRATAEYRREASKGMAMEAYKLAKDKAEAI